MLLENEAKMALRCNEPSSIYDILCDQIWVKEGLDSLESIWDQFSVDSCDWRRQSDIVLRDQLSTEQNLMCIFKFLHFK